MLYCGVFPMFRVAVMGVQHEQEGTEHRALRDSGVKH